MKSQSSPRLSSKLSESIFKSYKAHRKKKLVYFVCLSTFLLCAEATFIFRVQKDMIAMAASENPTALSANELLWEKTYGGAGDNRAFDIVPSGDGGFLVVGSSASFVPGKTVAWIVRTDSAGNMLWNKTYEAQDNSIVRQALKLSGGFLLVGAILRADGSADGWIIRIDESGNAVWNKTLGGNGTNELFSAAVAPDGYVLAGFAYPPGSVNSTAWIVKTDTDGNVTWNKTYGGQGSSAFRGIILAGDGEYITAGYTNTWGDGDYDFWLMKINQKGDVVWNQTYGGSQDDLAYGLAATTNGYVLAGETHSFGEGDADAFAVKTDLSGNLLWEKAYGGKQFDVANALISSNSGEYVFAGTTFSYGAGNRDFWIFKIDDNGNLLWSRTWGTAGFEEAYSVLETGQNEYVLAGWFGGLKPPPYDFCVVKMRTPVSNDDSIVIRLSNFILIVLGMTIALLLGFWVFRLKTKEKRKA